MSGISIQQNKYNPVAHKQLMQQCNSAYNPYKTTNFQGKDSFDKNDSSNDGKFELKEAGKNFVKGVVSPVTAMFSSVKNFCIGAGMIAGGAALIVATGGAAAPVLVGLGVGTGVFEAGVAVSKMVKAEDGDDVEKAFFNVGSATSAIGLSVAGAKSSLKSAGKDVTGLNTGEIAKINPFKATKECFNTIGKSLKASKEVFKSADWKINLELPILKRTKYKDYAQKLENKGKEAFSGAFKEVENMLPDEMKSYLVGRYKSKGSIIKKLVKKTKQSGKIKDYETATERCTDLIGTRLIMDTTTPEQIDALVLKMMNAIKNGEVEITEIYNYHGPSKKQYFNEGHIQALQEAVKKTGKTLKVGEKTLKKSGYTTAQMKIKHKNGVMGELQIRGKEIHSLSEVEHIVYDIREGKDITEGISALKEVYGPIEDAAYLLDNKNEALYGKYLIEMYDYKRSLEMGIPSQEPTFPRTIDKVLKIENLEAAHTKAQKIKKNLNKS